MHASIPDNNLLQWMRDLRRRVHRRPELAFQEQETAALIAAELDRLGLSYQAGLAGGTGIRAELGSGKGPCIALRADMDALPITEETGLPFASRNKGIMHACGHDGHVAMLLGAARLLRDIELPGRVVLLFQPAEESGGGAAAMIEDKALSGVEMIFAGHLDIHYPVGHITVDSGLICSYTDPFSITIQGRGGHAARPHEAVDAAVIAAHLVMNMQTLVSRRIDPARAAVVTVGRIEAGTVHNVIAEHARLEGTVRSADTETRERILAGLKRVVHGMREMCGASIELEFFSGLPAVINDEQATKIARTAAIRVAGEERVISQGGPSLGGEDFAFYQQQIPGCLVRFGAAGPGLTGGAAHSSRFDFDEHALATGAAWLVQVGREAMDRLQG